MENDNLISTVYLLVEDNGFLNPVIYLQKPEGKPVEQIFEFSNPFEAKKYIVGVWGQFVEVTVQRAA